MRPSFAHAYPIKLLLLLAVAAFTAGCVPRSDYEALQQENQELQKSLDQANVKLQQAMAQLQASMLGQVQKAELEAKLREAQREVEEKEAELRQIESRWEKFKGDRRKAMVGKTFEELALDDGRVLKKVEITGFSDDQVAIRHESGFVKVALAKSSEDLRWLACFDPLEASDNLRKARLAQALALSSSLDAERNNKSGQPSASSSSKDSTKTASAIEAAAVRKTIEAQRQALNAAYQRLASRNPAAMRGADWNSSRPEDSGLINVFAQRRVVPGFGELDSLAAAIRANQRKLRDLENVSP